MFRKFFAVLLMLLTLLIAACGEHVETKEKKNLVLYSQLSQEFTEALLKSYDLKNSKFTISAIYELKPELPKPDMILAERNVLLELQEANELQPTLSGAGDMLPAKFKDEAGYWYGTFYDPVVFLINQQYARTVGQEKLRGWFDLENLRGARIVAESVSNSKSSTNFLCALASNLGENVALNYLWNINQNIVQYAKFPFTPVRMTAVGDADISITRQSYVAKYLENNFPAYVITPHEGTPINLYGAAVYKGSKNTRNAINFIEWLIADSNAKMVSQSIDTGFTFILSQENKDTPVDVDLLWLNTEYVQKAQQEALISHWLEKVRFSDKN